MPLDECPKEQATLGAAKQWDGLQACRHGLSEPPGFPGALGTSEDRVLKQCCIFQGYCEHPWDKLRSKVSAAESQSVLLRKDVYTEHVRTSASKGPCSPHCFSCLLLKAQGRRHKLKPCRAREVF